MVLVAGFLVPLEVINTLSGPRVCMGSCSPHAWKAGGQEANPTSPPSRQKSPAYYSHPRTKHVSLESQPPSLSAYAVGQGGEEAEMPRPHLGHSKDDEDTRK